MFSFLRSSQQSAGVLLLLQELKSWPMLKVWTQVAGNFHLTCRDLCVRRMTVRLPA